jgi:hypothetical protein
MVAILNGQNQNTDSVEMVVGDVDLISSNGSVSIVGSPSAGTVDLTVVPGSAGDATSAAKGVTKLSADGSPVTDPIAVGTQDANWMTLTDGSDASALHEHDTLSPSSQFNLNSSGDVNINLKNDADSLIVSHEGADTAGIILADFHFDTQQTAANHIMFRVFNGTIRGFTMERISGFNGVFTSDVLHFGAASFSPSGAAEYSWYQADESAGVVAQFRAGSALIPCWIGTAALNGASAVGFRFRTENSFTTSGAIHSKWENAGSLLMDLDKDGNLDLVSGGALQVSGTQVVAARDTGWADPTGTADKTTYATASVTTEDLAEFVFAMYNALKGHGLIGA